jgi:CheY-like chemotaxis protein
MSHEIRNPMTTIVGFTEVLLRRDDLPQGAHRQLMMVDRAAAALVGVVDDITDLSRLDTAAIAPQPRDTVPQAIAREALSMVAARARAKGLGLEQTLSGLVDHPCRVDDLRLRQILLTLLDNALKFTERGHVRLDVSARLDGERMILRFAVADTGRGVAPDQIGRLFDRFGQAAPDLGETGNGGGLGLAVCKRLIELLGGRIGVESVAGKGSTFWIEAPAEPIAEAPAAPGVGRLDARVLLVDDNPANRELGATVLDLLGCEVTLAEDGVEALDLVSKGGFDVVLMDVHMPRMNGLDATRAIRALPGPAAAIPIIAMTADVLPEQVQRCRAAGMVDHIGKPIRLDDLYAALERWIGKSARDAANAA